MLGCVDLCRSPCSQEAGFVADSLMRTGQNLYTSRHVGCMELVEWLRSRRWVRKRAVGAVVDGTQAM